jgi:5'-3' exonuclease
LNEDDLRRAYYARKLNLVVDDEAEKYLLEENADKPRLSLEDLAHEYLLGLAWNLKYYTEGCASWGWFYPQQYGPFLQDMLKLTQFVNREHPYLKPKEFESRNGEIFAHYFVFCLAGC